MDVGDVSDKICIVSMNHFSRNMPTAQNNSILRLPFNWWTLNGLGLVLLVGVGVGVGVQAEPAMVGWRGSTRQRNFRPFRSCFAY